MKTNIRVDKVLDYIPIGSKVADIGCDHGYVLIKGVLEDIIIKGIGIEVAKGPYYQAKKNVKEYKLEDKIDIRFGNGLNPLLNDECDICVIGGMGGRLITSIINEDLDKLSLFKRLVLQPMNSESILRRFLLSNNWKIIDEEILIEDRLYLYIVAEKGNMKVNDDFLFEIGPVLAKKNNIGRDQYITEKLMKLEKIKKNLKKIKIEDKNNLKKIDFYIKKWSSYLEN